MWLHVFKFFSVFFFRVSHFPQIGVHQKRIGDVVSIVRSFFGYGCAHFTKYEKRNNWDDFRDVISATHHKWKKTRETTFCMRIKFDCNAQLYTRALYLGCVAPPPVPNPLHTTLKHDMPYTIYIHAFLSLTFSTHGRSIAWGLVPPQQHLCVCVCVAVCLMVTGSGYITQYNVHFYSLSLSLSTRYSSSYPRAFITRWVERTCETRNVRKNCRTHKCRSY